MRRPMQCWRLLPLLLVWIWVAGCARTPAQKEAEFLKNGKELLAKSDFGRALLEFRNASQVMPLDAEPYYQSALIYLERHDAAPALRLLRKAVELNPKHAGAQLRLAAFELGSSDPQVVQSAQERVQQVLTAASDDPNALQMRAMADLRLGKVEDAQKELEKALQIAPGHLQAAFNLAKLKMFSNDMNGAEAVLKQAAQESPKSPDAALLLAGFYWSKGVKAEAERQVRRALELDSRNLAALTMLADIQLDAGHLDQADQTYRTMSALPGNPIRPAHAVFLFQQNRRDEAIAELVKLYKSDPSDRNLRSVLFSMYYAGGRPAEAQQMIEEALRKSPHDTDALMKRSAISLAAGRLKEAEDEMAVLLHYEPNSAQGHYVLSRVYAAQGKIARQRQELYEVLKRTPGMLAARIDLAKLMLNAKEAPAALDLLAKVPADQTRDPAYMAVRNWVMMALGRFQEARQGIDAALSITPSADIRYQDALLRFNQQDYSGARSVLENLLKKSPNSFASLDLLAKTYAAQNNMPKALEVVRDYSSRQPHSASIKYLFGIWNLRAGYAGIAQQAFQEAALADPNYTAPQLLLGEMDLADGNLSGARRILNKVLMHDSDNLRATFLSGVVEERSGNMTAAEAKYRAVIARDPSNEEALNNLAFLLSKTNPDEALAFAEKAVALAPDDPAAEDTIGWVYFRKGSYSTALNYLKKSVDTQKTAMRHLHLAVTYKKLGDSALFGKNLQSALALDPKLDVSEASR